MRAGLCMEIWNIIEHVQLTCYYVSCCDLIANDVNNNTPNEVYDTVMFAIPDP